MENSCLELRLLFNIILYGASSLFAFFLTLLWYIYHVVGGAGQPLSVATTKHGKLLKSQKSHEFRGNQLLFRAVGLPGQQRLLTAEFWSNGPLVSHPYVRFESFCSQGSQANFVSLHPALSIVLHRVPWGLAVVFQPSRQFKGHLVTSVALAFF